MIIKCCIIAVILIYHKRFSHAQNHQQSSRSITNFDFINVKIIENYIRTIYSISAIECSIQCTGNELCISYGYNEISETCILYDTDFTNFGSIAKVFENGWYYSYVIKGK